MRREDQMIKYHASTFVDLRGKSWALIGSDRINESTVVLTKNAMLVLALFGLDYSLNFFRRMGVDSAQQSIFPWTVWNVILRFLSEDQNQNIIWFDKTRIARFSYSVLFPELLLSVNELVSAALRADVAFVRKMVDSNSSYLLQRGEATDYLGRVYKAVTPFQAALITGDLEMLRILKPYFGGFLVNAEGDEVDGDAEMRDQFEEIFPEGVRVDTNAHEKMAKQFFIKNPIETIINKASDHAVNGVLTRDEDALALCRQLDWFEEVVKSNARHFNPYLLQQAARIYQRNFHYWGENKLSLFSVKVFGVIQKYAPAVWWQHFAQGVLYITQGAFKPGQSFELHDNKGDIRPIMMRGDCFVSVLGVSCGFVSSSQALYGADDHIEKIITDKNRELQNLFKEFSPDAGYLCLIQ